MYKIKIPISVLPEFLEMCKKQNIIVNNGIVFGDDFGSTSYSCIIDNKFSMKLSFIILSKIGELIDISNDETMIPFNR
jgi:hypothetical protein